MQAEQYVSVLVFSKLCIDTCGAKPQHGTLPEVFFLLPHLAICSTIAVIYHSSGMLMLWDNIIHSGLQHLSFLHHLPAFMACWPSTASNIIVTQSHHICLCSDRSALLWLRSWPDACAAEQGKASSSHLEVFSTRPDTLFGATYMVVAPEHALLQQLTTDGQQQQVQAYVAAAGAKSDLERTELQKVKTGVFTGARPSSCRHMCKVVQSMAWHAPCLARSRDVNLCFG